MESNSIISTLVSTLVYEFQGIHISNAFDGEFKLYQAQPAILQLRLLRWAQAVGAIITEKDEYQEMPLRGGGNMIDVPTLVLKGGLSQTGRVEDVLHAMRLVLGRAQKESLRCNRPKNTDEMSNSFQGGGEELCPPRFKRLNLKLQELINKRWHDPTRVKGTRWLLHHREQCELFKSQILGHFDQLEKFVEPESRLVELSQEDCKAMGDSLTTLLDVIGECDPRLKEAAKKRLQDEENSTRVSFSATNNYGQQIGVFRAEMRGISFGTNNTIHNQW
ncbi:hypothetical protein AK830_g2044 [Neonectria ditissima]|uniref:Prion-inhibition and propagation HeLo domain-containing protein n=1 Tax=Neonectria ditissima TaxID=78410 RepID=A0A0P7BXC9_9HYPO|nr:hypothetical protein AK830_g2044 [Neonectria ditissima]